MAFFNAGDLFSCGGREFPFGGGDPEPGDIGYVSPDAVEGFGYDYEYDYDDSHRAKRSLNGSGNKCRVAGLRCAEFPMVGQCSGVAVGQCRHAGEWHTKNICQTSKCKLLFPLF